MSKDVDYEIYNTNNVFVQRGIIDNIKSEHSISNVMVEDLNLYSNEPTRSIYIRSIYDSRFDGCGFT